MSGQECVGVDLKRVCKADLKKKFGRTLHEASGSFDNTRCVDPLLKDWYPESNLGSAKVTHEHMKEVIEVIPPKDALQLGQLSMFFMNIKERLYDRMCEEWKKGGKSASDDTPLQKLLLAKAQEDLIRNDVIKAIPKERWQQSQHLSHNA